MKASDLHLLELLDINPDQGSIHFQDRRMLLWDADAFGSLRKELVNSLGSEQARPILKRFGFANGYRDALMTKSLLNWDNDREWWLACPSLQRHEGKVQPAVRHLLVDREAGAFEMEVEWTHSYEAEQHWRIFGESQTPVCWTLAGFASGYATAMMGEECIVVETECAAMGGSCCKVSGKTRKAWGDRGEAYAKDYAAHPLASELDAREKELRERQLRLAKRERELERARRPVQHESAPISQSSQMQKLIVLCDTVSKVDSTVLVSGESGSGKERIARFIHEQSEHSDDPFVAVNCGALPEALLESELFGYVKDALTGANSAKQGLFETTGEGTLFLDDIGEMSPASQVKLLRALQEREVWPTGATEPRPIRARIMAATSRDLSHLVEEGKFRSDLFYRLNVVVVDVPPLRSRQADILPLAREFIAASCERNGVERKTFTPEAAEALSEHPWPGNVRELQNIIERAIITSGATGKIERAHLSPAIGSVAGDVSKVRYDQVMPIAELERRYVLEVLARYNGNRTRTAKALGIGANTLWRKLKGWGVPPARGDSRT